MLARIRVLTKDSRNKSDHVCMSAFILEMEALASALRKQASLLEEPGREVLEVAAPGLPFVRCAGRFVEDVLDVGLCESIVQLDDTEVHLGRFLGSHADPDR